LEKLKELRAENQTVNSTLNLKNDELRTLEILKLQLEEEYQKLSRQLK
jgi:Tfp pilus assembly protein PilO